MKLTCSCGASAEFRDDLGGAINKDKWLAEHRDCVRLRAERDALKADAERYRWLRSIWECDDVFCPLMLHESSDTLDAAIDAAKENV